MATTCSDVTLDTSAFVLLNENARLHDVAAKVIVAGGRLVIPTDLVAEIAVQANVKQAWNHLRMIPVVHAQEPLCAHELAAQPRQVRWDVITCAFHGARFDVRTGKRDKPAWLLGSLIGGDCVQHYDAVVEDGRLLVELSDAVT